MAKIKDVELVLSSGRKIPIPIWSNKAKDGLKCHIDRITWLDEIRQIKLHFYDDRTRVYDVLDVHIRKRYKKRIKRY